MFLDKGYMAQQPIGTTTLNFNFSAGNPQTLQITVSDSTPSGGGSSSQPPKLL
ncbi:MAG: X2-like carbohydrate binding domain-containing protein [Desulfosporosinus sp.]|nr:X2-like carbohydrate binding domain-containing protein [Desulfosporosinus sp.]